MIKSAQPTFLMNEKIIIAITFAWLITLYHLIFHHYFPLPNGNMGHDYAQFLPMLIDNYFWFMNNGVFSPPWFSPAFCGGQVNFADPQSMYYSLPQFLLFAGLPPIQAIYISVLAFASAGFWGMYLLTKVRFKFSLGVALTCAAIFMFNGFFIYRMIVGHLTYQGFMLIPLITYFLLDKTNITSQLSTWVAPITAGTLLAYWCLSGMLVITIPCLLSIFAIILIYLLHNQNASWVLILKKFFIASIVGLSLSASKFVGALSLMEIFPRTQYKLPGFEGFINILKVFFNSLFFSTHYADALNKPLWKNNTLLRLPDEYAFGVTIIPLAIITIGLLIYILQRPPFKVSYSANVKKIAAALLIVASIPFLVNYYDPSWNAILKQIPVISATTSPLRWLLIYIFILIIFSGFAQHAFKKARHIVSIICIIAIPILVLLENKHYYDTQPYAALALEKEFTSFMASKKQPMISNNIMVTPTPSIRQNSYLIQGANALNCYNPTYGYSLEKAEFKTLAVAPVLALMSPTTFNIRNPACIIYPKENNCKLWDNFSTDQIDSLEQFVTYRPFAFERSQLQKSADIISLMSVWLVTLFFVLCLLKSATRWFSN